MRSAADREMLKGDTWGGLAAMLVALPAAIAFGVTIYAPLGGGLAAQGALAGILGAMALGLIAGLLGGTPRLISAPCAPAAAVLSALAVQYAEAGMGAAAAVLTLTLIGLLAGALQIGLGAARIGSLIKYMPYPVVSGYLTGVGLIIIASQTPKLLGIALPQGFFAAIVAPETWNWAAIAVGSVTIASMQLAPQITKRAPPAVIALGAGTLAHLALGLVDASLWRLDGNPLVVGTIAGEGGEVWAKATAHFRAFTHLGLDSIVEVLVPALTLAVLLSIDTLKTAVVLDAMTHSRHDSNRELIGQGAGNIGASLLGGVPGAGTMGPTLINLAAGAKTKRSGLFAGGFTLIAFLLLAPVIAWVPVAALAAILIVVGLRMIDRQSLGFLFNPSTRFDFMVIAAVVAVALGKSLIAASAAGIVFAILIFLREQSRATVVRAKVEGGAVHSKRFRNAAQSEVLKAADEQTVILELQGSLFFGTAHQLYSAIEPEIGRRRYVILNMRRVNSIDVSASHMLERLEDMLQDAGGRLVFAELPRDLPSGVKLKKYLKSVGLVGNRGAVAFRRLDDALEWIEAETLATASLPDEETALELAELEIFRGRQPETLVSLAGFMTVRRYAVGERIFSVGDGGRDLYLIRRGSVRLDVPMRKKDRHHLGTFGRGDFFGEVSFLDGSIRAVDATAVSEAELYVLTREAFELLSIDHKAASLNIVEGAARILAARLRAAITELRAWRS